MRRRDVLLGAFAAALPVAVEGQVGKEARIGFLYGGGPESLKDRVGWFLAGLPDVEQRRLVVVGRSAEGDPARMPVLATARGRAARPASR
jgi:hypothetical protein